MIPDLSVVVAVYNEDPRNLLRLLERLYKALSPENISYEVVFVNDGSGPATSNALRQIASEVNYAKLIELSRNFGQQAAITAGLDHAAGNAIVNIDSDLQDPPELIPEMVKRWRSGYDVVYVQRSTRRDRFLKRASAYLFYRLLGSISSIQIPWDCGDFRLVDRKIVAELRALPERTRFLRGMIPWLGFRQIGITIDRDAREMGETSYTLRKLLTLAMDGLISFSLAPLYLVPMVGAVMVALGLIVTAAAVAQPHLFHIDNAVLLGILACMAGAQLLCTGIISVYVAKMLEEVRSRPTYIVAERRGLAFNRGSHDEWDTLSSVAIQAPARSD